MSGNEPDPLWEARRRNSARMMALALGGLVLLIFAIAMIKMAGAQ